VAPRATAPSSNRTNTRLTAGSNGIAPAAVAKTPKVGVPPPGISSVTLGAGAARQSPLAGSVRQRRSVTGRGTPPVSAVTVMVPETPTLDVATAKAPLPVGPGTATIPVFPIVADCAMTSGTGAVEVTSSSVLTPGVTGASATPAHVKPSRTSIGPSATPGSRAKT